MNHNQCFLCGIDLHGKARRFRTLQELHALVTSKCVSTPLAYQVMVRENPGPERRPLCIACVNWKRRALKRTGKAYLQLDQMILYVSHHAPAR